MNCASRLGVLAMLFRCGCTVCLVLFTDFLLRAQAGGLEREKTAITKLVQESQRSGHERHDIPGYMAIWAEDAKLVIVRSGQPGKYDSVMTRVQLEARARLKYRAPAPRGVRLEFADARVEVTGDKATLRYRSILKMKDSVGTAEEVFRLRKTDGKWKVYENRYWPVEIRFGDEVITFNKECWAKLDAEVERAMKTKNRREQALSLLDAWRFKEAHGAAKKLTEDMPGDATPWVLRGHAAMAVGDAKDALVSFTRALAIDRTADVPEYVRAQQKK